MYCIVLNRTKITFLVRFQYLFDLRMVDSNFLSFPSSFFISMLQIEVVMPIDKKIMAKSDVII